MIAQGKLYAKLLKKKNALKLPLGWLWWGMRETVGNFAFTLGPRLVWFVLFDKDCDQGWRDYSEEHWLLF